MIDVLGQRHEAHVSLPQTLQGLEGNPAVAGEAVELMDDNNIDEPGLGVGQHLLKCRALAQIIGPATPPFVAIDLANVPAMRLAIKATGPVLGVQAVALNLILRADSLVKSSPDDPGCGCRHQGFSSGSAVSVIGSMPKTSHSTRTPRATASLRAVASRGSKSVCSIWRRVRNPTPVWRAKSICVTPVLARAS